MIALGKGLAGTARRRPLRSMGAHETARLLPQPRPIAGCLANRLSACIAAIEDLTSTRKPPQGHRYRRGDRRCGKLPWALTPGCGLFLLFRGHEERQGVKQKPAGTDPRGAAQRLPLVLGGVRAMPASPARRILPR
jgi:hypothetical protein